MDLNLLLSAQTLHLAPKVKCSERINGLIVLKNVPARTYLRVTPEQWRILIKFEEPTMIPAVLDDAIRERQCLPVSEFYEVILKALRAKILLEPDGVAEAVTEHNWRWSVSPRLLEKPLYVLLFAGVVAALVFRPRLPGSILAAAIGIIIWVASHSLGEFAATCMLRGAGGEVYRPHFNWLFPPPHFAADLGDKVMLPARDQRAVALAVPAVLAAATGVTAWQMPEWAVFPLMGLIISLRPCLGGGISELINLGQERSLSDAEHSYLFPPNRKPWTRWRLLRRALSRPSSWARFGYGLVWALMILFWAARLSSVPSWGLAFWRSNGIRIAAGFGILLAGLAAGYVAWEISRRAAELGRAWRGAFDLWRRRWLAGERELPESDRMKVLENSPLFSAFQAHQRLEFARAMTLVRRGPRRALLEHSGTPTQISMIVSGTVNVRRRMPTGKVELVQILSEGDVIGIHDLADPKHPDYELRTRTPVTLLTIERAAVENLAGGQVEQEAITQEVLKRPFLRRISLCKNWHVQAVRRFARLSTIVEYTHGDVIVKEGQTVEDFFVIFQGSAKVTRQGRPVGIVRASGFFGEIGLLQNSASSATVTAHLGTRCMRIQRSELLRFVTHNYMVALELERVSSERLGRPIFPLRRGDFRSI
jgi:CRP-like cAMP-binding protein